METAPNGGRPMVLWEPWAGFGDSRCSPGLTGLLSFLDGSPGLVRGNGGRALRLIPERAATAQTPPAPSHHEKADNDHDEGDYPHPRKSRPEKRASDHFIFSFISGNSMRIWSPPGSSLIALCPPQVRTRARFVRPFETCTAPRGGLSTSFCPGAAAPSHCRPSAPRSRRSPGGSVPPGRTGQ